MIYILTEPQYLKVFLPLDLFRFSLQHFEAASTGENYKQRLSFVDMDFTVSALKREQLPLNTNELQVTVNSGLKERRRRR